MRSSGLMLLGIWLIGNHALPLLNFHFSQQKLVFAVLAMISGTFLLLHTVKTRFHEIGLLLLAMWLILNNGLSLFDFNFQYSGTVLELIAITAGAMLMLRK